MRHGILPLLFALAVGAARGGDQIGMVVDILGNEAMQLSGLGLVGGLNGTGDKSRAAQKKIRDYVVKYRLNLSNGDIDSGSLALVYVTAVIRPENAVGTQVEARVVALSGAKSLRNGSLLETPLQWGNPTRADQAAPVFARAQGKLTVNLNDPCSAVLPVSLYGGARVTATMPASQWNENHEVQLNLKRPSYADAEQIAVAINNSPRLNPAPPTRSFQERAAPPPIARAFDKGRVHVVIPRAYWTREVSFLKELTALEIELETRPTIKVDTEAGKVLVIGNVRIERAVTFGINGREIALQPTANPDDPPVYAPAATRRLVEPDGPGTNPDLQGLINTLSAMGMPMTEIAGLFRDLCAQGAIRADFVE